MPFDSQYAGYSDTLLVVAVLAYAAAMAGYATQYAFGTRGAIARSVHRRAPEPTPVLVPAGPDRTDAPTSDALASHGQPDGPRTHPVPPAVGRLAVALTLLGATAHAASLAFRGAAAGRVPWGNMYEFVLTACLVGVCCWLVLALRRPGLRHLGVFAMLAVILLLGIAALKLYTRAAPLVPALNSYWIKIHVSAAATASGIFLIGFLTAVMYLIRHGYDTRTAADRPVSFPYTLGPRLPGADTLERLAFRFHALAFPIWTFAIAAGAIWAEAAWGRYWGWDPKETWSFIAWVVYASYLHARATTSLRRRWVAWIAVLGWATMMVNLFAVNLVISGLHSYAGVS